MAASRQLRRRLALALMALLLFVAVTELGLQGLSLFARARLESRLARGGDSQAISVLCVGDSHTFGASLPEEQSYPSQLGALLDARLAPRRIRVVNAGFPGVNSSFVANRLEEQLLRYGPRVVIVWVGTNNRWNSLETEVWERSEGLRSLDRLLLRIKLYRLAKVIWTHRSPAGEDPGRRVRAGDRPPGAPASPVSEKRGAKLTDDELLPGIGQDMQRMTEIARAYATPILFTTYPLPDMAGPNRAIVATAERLAVPVVVTALDYRRALRDGHPATELILYAAGPHPTGVLYGYVAESMYAQVLALLEE